MHDAAFAAFFGLAPQVPHVNIERFGVRLEIETPDAFVDHVTGQHDAGVASQQLQQIELGLGQLQRSPVARHLAGRGIDREVADPDGFGDILGRRAPKQRTHAGQQLVERKRLDQVVVGAGVEPGDAIGHLMAGSQHQHGGPVTALAQRATHRQPVHDRHHHVEQQQIGRLLTNLLERLGAITCDPDLVALEPQRTRQRITDTGVVLGNENVGSFRQRSRFGAGGHRPTVATGLPQLEASTPLLNGFFIAAPRGGCSDALHQLLHIVAMTGRPTRLPDGTLRTEAFDGAYREAGWWQDRTLGDLINGRAVKHPDGVAYRWDGQQLSWSAYDDAATSIARRLAGEGVRGGDRVLVLAPDGGVVHAAYVGCERAGAVTVGVGWRAGEQELCHLVQRTGPTAAIVPPETRLGPGVALAERLGIGSVVVCEWVDDAVVPAPGPEAVPGQAVGPSDLFMLNSTSGTTGLPKCVMQTQNRWFYFHRLAAEFGELTTGESWMSVVPAPFGFGLWTSHFSPTILGAPCMVQPTFDAQAAARAVETYQITVLCAVSSQFAMILDQAAGADLTSLRVLFTGGERIPLTKALAFEEQTGCRVLNFYGSNETGLLSGTCVDDPLEHRVRTGGRVVADMQVRLYDPELRRIPGDVGTGRPACKGPATSPGYYQDAAANDELFVDGDWMLMGDIVEIDPDGWLTVVGRSADFIVRGGKNISAPAVEAEIATHPAVALVAVVAVPDERLGERVGACVTLVDGEALALDELLAHLASRNVSKEWWPEHLAVLDTLPTSSGGKVAKAELRNQAPTLFQL